MLDFIKGFAFTSVVLTLWFLLSAYRSRLRARRPRYGRDRPFVMPKLFHRPKRKVHSAYHRLLTALNGDIDKTNRYIQYELNKRPGISRERAADAALKSMPLHQR